MKAVSRCRIVGLIVSLSCACNAHGQWSDDAAANLAITDVSGDQVQVKIVERPGGGYFMSWFDIRASGYDVYVQRLDAGGNAQLAANGVLVADRSFSSTQDYGLSVDTDGNALVVFRDDRSGSTQITAAKVAADGTLPWGANGVTLSSGSAFFAAPKIAGTSDGQAMVAWKADNNVHLQRLDATGTPVLAGDIVITGSGGYSVADLHPADAGAAIVSLVYEPGGFMGPKHLYAQKYSAAGAALWGTSPLSVFDGGSLQFGNFPAFVPDGSGGAAFAWYDTAGGLETYAQRVTAAGVEAFAHNGIAVSTAPRNRVSPTVTFDPATESTIVFWREEVPGPFPDFGIYGQRFDATGARQWGNEGIVATALTTVEVGFPRAVWQNTGVTVFWIRTISFNDQDILAARFDASGNPVWSPAQLAVATTPSGKSRPGVAGGDNPFAVLAWSDNRAGNDDIFVQNANADGTLGSSAIDSDADGVPDDADNCVAAANANQRDTDGDGFGNLCDADLNQDCIVNATDLGAFKTVFFSSDADADFDGNGTVNAGDLGILRLGFFLPPGPSGLDNDCAP
jgi:hypothetical protein